MSQDQVNAPVQVSQQEEGFKVFVGNLAFATKDANLEEVFGKVGPLIKSIVIHRGARSLGYGFVTYVNEADAQKAVASLDKSDLQDRQINVELAKPPTEATPRAPREPRAPKADAPVANGEPKLDENGEVIPPKAKKPRAKRPKAVRRPRNDDETEEAGDAPVEGLTNGLAATNLDGTPAAATTAAPRARRARTAAAPALNEDGTPVERAPRAPRAPRARLGPPTGEVSPTQLFVANLPFSANDETLTTLFQGYKVASVRVVLKKMGAGAGRSKGFGFVDFENEAEQKRALEQLQHKELEGRPIELKVAIQRVEEPKAEEAAEPDATIIAS